MDDDTRATLLAAMYDPPDEMPRAPVAAGTRDPGESPEAMLRRSRRMVMGAVAFDVPTVEYVDSLERRAVQQERVIVEQGRHLRRLDILLSALRQAVRRNGSLAADLSRGLDGKLDRRDFG